MTDEHYVLHAIIHGDPVPKGRPRLSTRNGFTRMHTPARTLNWEKEAAKVLAATAKRQDFPTHTVDPLYMRVLAIYHRPKRLMRKSDPHGRMWRTVRPDCDNIMKACADALMLAGVIKDDAQIVHWTGMSLYADKGEESSVRIELCRALQLVG